ncbi:MAG: ABC transporter permease [Saprospiraceae bacterium]|nr:ABC transporter permease [Saprospiraceae bacterium]
MLFSLAWRNLWRNRTRTLITMASVFCAVVLAVFTSSIQQGTFAHLIKNVVGSYTGYVQVQHSAYWQEKNLENTLVADDSLLASFAAVKGVKALAPRLETFALASSGEKSRGAMVVGILPEAERHITALPSRVVEGVCPDSGQSAAMIPKGLAKKLGLGLGDTLLLLGQGYYGSQAAGKYPVAGLLEFGAPELNERLILLPLPAAQTLFDAQGLATSLVILPENTQDLTPLLALLRARGGPEMAVMSWAEMLPEITEHIQTDTASSSIIIGVLYLLISFGIFSTLLMMLAERRREFGMLVALGMKKASIARVLLYESVLISFLGCLAGLAAAAPLTWYFHVHPLRFGGKLAEMYEKFGFEPVMPTLLDPDIFIRQGLTVLVMGLVLSVYPVVKVFYLDPVNAMRS